MLDSAIVTAPAQAIAGGLRGVGLGLRDLIARRGSPNAANAGHGGESMTVIAGDGLELYAEIDGPDDPTSTVVFVHGFSLDLTNWREQRPALAASGARCVYYDQRGFGQSPPGELPASMRLLAADLACVIEQQATGPVTLVGHSMGVMVIAALAGIRPELFGAEVSGTVMVAGNAAEIASSEFGLGAFLGPLMQRVGLTGLQAAARIPHVQRLTPEAVYLMIAGMFMCDRTASDDTLRDCVSMISHNGLDRLAAYGAAMYDHDERDSLPALGRAPCLVLAAEHDRFIPGSLTRALADGTPGATLTVVPNSGHMLPFEHPEIVTEAILGMLKR